MRKDLKLSTVKKLFALSGNKCAFPNCNQCLVDEHGNIFAQICHIEAAEQGGERYNPNQTDEERRSFENLVLLCANHHIESNNVVIWTVEKLKAIKSEHETKYLKVQFEISDEVAQKALFFDLLENIKTELDKENAGDAQKILESVKNIISNLNDEDLNLEYEILECRCLQKLEKINEAKEKYESLIKRYSDDPRAFLYLAEISLNDNDFDKNLELLQKAEKIDKDYWLLELEHLVRKNRLEEKIDLKNIDENNFPNDLKIKSNFYRLYALFFEDENHEAKADSFIEKAIHTNPDRFSNYLAKLSILEKRLFSEQKEKLKQAKELIEEMKRVEDKFLKYGDIGVRNKVILNVKKLNALRLLENFPEFEKVSKETFELSISCCFDKQIEQIITIVLQFVSLPDDDLNKLLKYIKNSKKEISDELSKILIFQFNIREKLLTDGKKFFTEIKNQKYIDFIEILESKNYEKVLAFLKGDIPFAVAIANTLKNFPELRKQIIENLPNDLNIQKEKLLLLLNFDEKDFDEAFSILKKLDLSELSNLECNPILEIIQQKNAWDFEVIVLQKLISKEKDERQKFNLQLQLFNAYYNLKQYLEVIQIGKELLELDSKINLLDTKNKEALLINTILACFERGKVENKIYTEAENILEKYPLSKPSFEFKAGIEAEIYLHNSKPQDALNAVIEGVKIKKLFSSQEYAKLFFLLSTKIGNQIDLKLISLDEVKENVFIKLKNKDQWYFIGDENELDAIKVSKTNEKYSLFEKKKLGSKIIFQSEYSSEKQADSIELIFPIEKYILWQVVQNFQKLSKDGDLEGVWMIEVPQKGDSIDIKNILKMMENMHKRTDPFFQMYLNNNVPLAMLAVSEGGITNAIGRIQNEQKGFINFSNGTIADFEKQKEVARDVIKKQKSFYIDGTSALFLSEIGYLKKIYKYVSNIKVPQSVINLLGEINEKFTYIHGQAGHIGYSQGKINYSSIDQEKRESIIKNISSSVELLESNSDSIEAISSANKADCFSEKEIPSELCDACILAQRDNIPIMTEDFIYLKMNGLQTKKKVPQYFSSLALLRVLCEDKKISFDEYLEYFGYLSSYRFRFLSLNSNDIEMAVFGDGDIKTVKLENIRKFNFPLTLSEDYGVPFQTAFTVIKGFLFKVLLDNAITAGVAEEIYIKILETFPFKQNKKDLWKLLLRICLRAIENNKTKFALLPNVQVINEKFDKLLQATEIYNSERQIWTPEE